METLVELILRAMAGGNKDAELWQCHQLVRWPRPLARLPVELGEQSQPGETGMEVIRRQMPSLECEVAVAVPGGYLAKARGGSIVFVLHNLTPEGVGLRGKALGWAGKVRQHGEQSEGPGDPRAGGAQAAPEGGAGSAGRRVGVRPQEAGHLSTQLPLPDR